MIKHDMTYHDQINSIHYNDTSNNRIINDIDNVSIMNINVGDNNNNNDIAHSVYYY